MIKVACLLLCAGQSRRMQGGNKLLMQIGDKSVVRRVAEEVTSATFSSVIAVTGYQREQVTKELQGLPIQAVWNENFEIGMHSSIRAGLMAMREDVDFFAICLGDQPLLAKGDYERMIEGAQQSPDTLLIYPVYNGARGNPVFISHRLREEVLQHPDDDRGCHYLFARYKDNSLAVEMPSRASVFDVDTEELLQQARLS